MKHRRKELNVGARVRTVRACGNCFAKGQHGTVAQLSRDGHYCVRFDQGIAWWLHEDEFERIPERRRRVVFFERLALAWHRVVRGASA